MADIEYGFFESSESLPRLYFSDSFNKYFEGLIPANGVFFKDNIIDNGASGDLEVVPSTNGFGVTVRPGKAIVDNHWYRQHTSEILNLTSANPSLDRYDFIVLRCNSNLSRTYNGTSRSTSDTVARTVELAVIPGPVFAPSATEQYPTLNQYESSSDDGIYELFLAAVKVRHGATVITKNDIYYSVKNGTIKKPYIELLYKQPDIKELESLYSQKFAEYEKYLRDWISKTEKVFDAWFYNMTDNLMVGGYVVHYDKRVTNPQSTITLDMEGYTYDSKDLFIVNLNGLILREGVEFTVDGSQIPYATLSLSSYANMRENTNILDIKVMKSNLTSDAKGTLSSAKSNGSGYLYANDIMLGRGYGFKIWDENYRDQNVVIDYCTRNLFFLDNFVEETKSGLSLTKTNDGGLRIEGTNTSGADVTFSCEVSTRAFANTSDFTIYCTQYGTPTVDGATITPVDIGIYDSNDTLIAEASDDTGSHFTVTSSTFDGDTIVLKITAHSDMDVSNWTIYPSIEYGETVNGFVPSLVKQFTYSKVNGELPEFEDTISFLWPDTVQISDMQLFYYVLADGNADNIQY